MITVNTQSSIRIEEAGLVVRFDPYGIKGRPCDADIVFITHAHYDHYSPADISKVSNGKTVYITSKDVDCPGGKRVLPGESFEVKGVKVETVPAYNIGKEYHPKDNNWQGYIITLDGKRYYIAGDTDAVPELADIKCDVALVPIGGRYTMDVAEAAAFINKIKPAEVIPTHYGSIVGRPEMGEEFARLVDPQIKVSCIIGE